MICNCQELFPLPGSPALPQECADSFEALCILDIPNKMPSLVAVTAVIIIARSSLSDAKYPVICNPNACDDGKMVRVPFSVAVSRHH